MAAAAGEWTGQVLVCGLHGLGLPRRAADGGRLEHPPRRDTRFVADDVAYLVGPYEELLAVLRRDAVRTP